MELPSPSHDPSHDAFIAIQNHVAAAAVGVAAEASNVASEVLGILYNIFLFYKSF